VRGVWLGRAEAQRERARRSATRTDVASFLPNSERAETAIVNGTTLVFLILFRLSTSTSGRIAEKTEKGCW
jgi:hypothetical protein